MSVVVLTRAWPSRLEMEKDARHAHDDAGDQHAPHHGHAHANAQHQSAHNAQQHSAHRLAADVDLSLIHI